MTVIEKATTSQPTMQAERHWSYTSATSDTPLLGLTIGDLFDQTVEKYSDTPIPRSATYRLSASPTPSTAKKSWPGSR